MGRAAATGKRKRRRQERLVEVGPGIVQASMEDILAAIQAVDPELPWSDAADAILPVFPRRRPMPLGVPDAVLVHRAPGLEVGMGIDIGPAFMYVSELLLERWAVDADTAFDRAVANVRERCATRRLDPAYHGHIGDVPTTFFQSGESVGSALLLLPDEIVSRLGGHPQYVMAPMRDLLVSVPLDAGLGFATWLREAIAEDDPNCLDLPVFSLIAGDLRIASHDPREPGSALLH